MTTKKFSKLTIGQILSLIFLVSLLLAVPLTFLKTPTSTTSRAQKTTIPKSKCPETVPLLQRTCDDGYWEAKTDQNGCPYIVCQEFEPKELSYTVLLQGSWAKDKKGDHVIQTTEDYYKLLKENLGLTKKIPKVNFKTQAVVAYFLGETSQDVKIEVEKIADQGNRVLVSLKETKVEKPPPKPTTYHPFIIIRLPKTDKPIEINHKTS